MKTILAVLVINTSMIVAGGLLLKKDFDKSIAKLVAKQAQNYMSVNNSQISYYNNLIKKQNSLTEEVRKSYIDSFVQINNLRTSTRKLESQVFDLNKRTLAAARPTVAITPIREFWKYEMKFNQY